MFGNINEAGELENDELIDKVRIPLGSYINALRHNLEFVRISFAIGNSTRVDRDRGGRCTWR